MKPLPRLDVVPLFPAERHALLSLLSSLTPEQWALPTVCEGWCVKDIASHLIGDDIGRLAWQRDAHSATRFEPKNADKFEAELGAFIIRQNEEWVAATRRLSTRMIIDLLGWSGGETQALFESLDPDAMGLGVSWAGESESANWFDLAREYTERWHHQAQIREAVGAPMLYETHLFMPVIDAMIRAVPHSLRGVHSPEGTQLVIEVTGDDPRRFTVRRESRWALYVDADGEPESSVAMDGDTAWRLLTRNISRAEIVRRCQIRGDASLTNAAFDAFALVA